MKESNPYRYFKTKKDYTKWDNFIKQIDEISLSDEDKMRARNAIHYLEKTLGKAFFSDVIKSGHPLLSQYFMNATGVARIKLIDFAESLQTFENSYNFHTLTDKIKKAKKFSEGCTILETAHKFHKVDFSVAFDLEISFVNGNKSETKKPDIKITNNTSEEDIYVEVSEIGKSEADLDNSRTYQCISRLIRNIISSDPEMTDFTKPKHILPHVKILRAMSDKELIGAGYQIQKIVEEVRNSGEFREMIIGDMIEIAVSPSNDHSKARVWAKERDMTDFVKNYLFYPNELSRVLSRLEKKLEQLPLHSPGIVVLWNNHNLLFFLHKIEEIMEKVASRIASHPNVYGVALNQNIGLAKPENGAAQIGEHLIISNTRRDFTTRNTVLIRNKFFNISLTHMTEEKLLASFVYSCVNEGFL